MNDLSARRAVEAGSDYAAFIKSKAHEGAARGFEPTFMPSQLFDFQAAMVDYAIGQGRAALFEDCGLGKTVQMLTWAQNVVEHDNRPVLILTPLAVSGQTIREAEKFGIEASRSAGGEVSKPKIVVTNYEKLAHFDPADFAGIVCDESSCLKAMDGSRKDQITSFMRKTPYRLLATATPSPNDFIELGTSSEALGHLGAVDMLMRFFVNDQNNIATRRMYGEAPSWRFKGHAERPFWRWVCSWSRAMRRPSDLGFEDGPFVLPPLIERPDVIEARTRAEGQLFALAAENLFEQREERRRTLRERCERVAALADHGDPVLIWCHLNDEADLIESLIPGSIQVSGSDTDEAKEEAFTDFAAGRRRALITKPRIGAFGLNFQHCAHVIYFPSHSYEQYYQAVRRCWRFGQTRPVTVDLVMTEGDAKVMANLARKSAQASEMFDALIAEMANAMGVAKHAIEPINLEAPSWLKSIA